MTPEYLHFSNRENFNHWHDKVKQGLGLPRIGVNAATGRLAPEKQRTTDYVESEDHPEGSKGHICRINADCPEKLRDQQAENTHNLTHKETAILEKEGWFKDRIARLEPPTKPTTKTKA